MMDTRSQRSSDNPGWIGPGIPSLRQLVRDRPISIVRKALQGQFAASRHLAASTIADLWNFHLRLAGGNEVTCPLCEWTGPAFLATSNWRTTTYQSRCPRCDSRSRHRGLALLLPRIMSEAVAGPILYFAPEGILLNTIRKLIDRDIITTDLNSVDVDRPGEDIQKLTFPEDSFAVILCNHVLEHIPDDRLALQSCARVLKRGGVAIFTIPGDFSHETTWEFRKLDSNGHFRHYGIGIINIMRTCFNIVTPIDMSTITDQRSMVHKNDIAFACIK